MSIFEQLQGQFPTGLSQQVRRRSVAHMCYMDCEHGHHVLGGFLAQLENILGGYGFVECHQETTSTGVLPMLVVHISQGFH